MKRKSSIFIIDGEINRELIARIDPDFYVKLKTGESIADNAKDKFATDALRYIKGQLHSYEVARVHMEKLKHGDSMDGPATGHVGVNEILDTAFQLVLNEEYIRSEVELLVKFQTNG